MLWHYGTASARDLFKKALWRWQWGLLRSAQHLLSQARSAAPDSPLIKVFPCLLAIDRPENAELFVQEQLASQPHHLAWQTRLALFLSARGRDVAAETAFCRALALSRTA